MQVKEGESPISEKKCQYLPTCVSDVRYLAPPQNDLYLKAFSPGKLPLQREYTLIFIGKTRK